MTKSASFVALLFGCAGLVLFGAFNVEAQPPAGGLTTDQAVKRLDAQAEREIAGIRNRSVARKAYAAKQNSPHAAELDRHYARHYHATLGVVLSPASGPLAVHLTNGAIDQWTGANMDISGNPGYGLVIRHVAPGSPAAHAGLMRFDIIVAFGTQRLYGVKQFNTLLGKARPGQTVKLSVVQVGEKQVTTMDVKLGWGELLNPGSGPSQYTAPAKQPSNPNLFGNEYQYLPNLHAPPQDSIVPAYGTSPVHEPIDFSSAPPDIHKLTPGKKALPATTAGN